jgi:hypothetical protein
MVTLKNLPSCALWYRYLYYRYTGTGIFYGTGTAKFSFILGTPDIPAFFKIRSDTGFKLPDIRLDTGNGY